VPAGPSGVSTPWRAAPSAVLRLEAATDPRRRARVQSRARRQGVSDRLRRHLAEIAALVRDRESVHRSSPNDPPTVRVAVASPVTR